jgi:hypothetical protein
VIDVPYVEGADPVHLINPGSSYTGTGCKELILKSAPNGVNIYCIDESQSNSGDDHTTCDNLHIKMHDDNVDPYAAAPRGSWD